MTGCHYNQPLFHSGCAPFTIVEAWLQASATQ